MVLLFDTKINIATKLNPKRVEIGVGPLDGRTVHSAQKRDLQRREPIRVGEQIPRLPRRAVERPVAKIRGRNNGVFANVWIVIRGT